MPALVDHFLQVGHIQEEFDTVPILVNQMALQERRCSLLNRKGTPERSSLLRRLRRI
jgi:hypothetical protein